MTHLLTSHKPDYSFIAVHVWKPCWCTGGVAAPVHQDLFHQFSSTSPLSGFSVPWKHPCWVYSLVTSARAHGLMPWIIYQNTPILQRFRTLPQHTASDLTRSVGLRCLCGLNSIVKAAKSCGTQRPVIFGDVRGGWSLTSIKTGHVSDRFCPGPHRKPFCFSSRLPVSCCHLTLAFSF